MAEEPTYEGVISNKKGEPDDQKLYDQVKAEAKTKFEVYPSAYANGWVVQEYKRRGGTYSAPKTTKGIQMDNIENLKAELAKAEARLADITDSLAKGGPGSGPHKGGGASEAQQATRTAEARTAEAKTHDANGREGGAGKHLLAADAHKEAALANAAAGNMKQASDHINSAIDHGIHAFSS